MSKKTTNPLKENTEVPKNGLIKLPQASLEVFFSSDEFHKLYLEGAIKIAGLDMSYGEGRIPNLPNLSNLPIKPEDLWGPRAKPTIKTKHLPDSDEQAIKDTKDRKDWPPPGPVESLLKLSISSVEIKNGEGFIEFEALEFPLDTLKALTIATGRSDPSDPSDRYQGIEVVWLDPNKSKLTHTKISIDGKTQYKEHDFKDLEKLFNNSYKEEEKKGKKKSSRSYSEPEM